MNKKWVTWGVVVAVVAIVILIVILSIRSCQPKYKFAYVEQEPKPARPADLLEKQKPKPTYKDEAIKYNETLAITLANSQADEFKQMAKEDFSTVTAQELKDSTMLLGKMREMIAASPVNMEGINPALKEFFAKYGTDQKIIPEIAFKKLLPTIPQDKGPEFKQAAQAMMQELTKTLGMVFEKYRQAFKEQGAQPIDTKPTPPAKPAGPVPAYAS